MTGSLSSSIPIKTTNSYDIGSATLGLAGVYFGNAGGSTTIRVISDSSVSSSATYTIPDVGTSADFVMTAGSQTISGIKTFGNVITVADGSESDPSITFTNDQNTGFFAVTADELGIATGGAQRARFRSVGMDIDGNADTTSVAAASIVAETFPMVKISNDAAANGSGGGFIAETRGQGWGGMTVEAVTTADSKIKFWTSTTADTPVERMSINQSGLVTVAGSLNVGGGDDVNIIEWGGWGPTYNATGSSNITSATGNSGYYIRIGNVVSFGFGVLIQATNGTSCIANFDLPITSNFSSANNCQATMTALAAGTVQFQGAGQADTGVNGQINLRFRGDSVATSTAYRITGTYVVQ